MPSYSESDSLPYLLYSLLLWRSKTRVAVAVPMDMVVRSRLMLETALLAALAGLHRRPVTLCWALSGTVARPE